MRPSSTAVVKAELLLFLSPFLKLIWIPTFQVCHNQTQNATSTGRFFFLACKLCDEHTVENHKIANISVDWAALKYW